MSKNLSAAKRIQISVRNRSRNRFYKSTIKTSIKKYILGFKNLDNNIGDYLSDTYSTIDKAVKRGVIHKNNGARKKSKLAQAMKVENNNNK